ncbi:hypothetical protein [Cellulomonas sp. URHB0016]
MAEVVARYVQLPDVEFGVYVLTDVLAPENPLSRSGGTRGEDRLVSTAPYGAVLHSAGNDFQPSVELRVLSGEPTADPVDAGGTWEREATVDFEAISGSLRLESVNGLPAGEDVRLPAPGRYAVRVRCRGRADAAARRGRELFYSGVEEWLLELWQA